MKSAAIPLRFQVAAYRLDANEHPVAVGENYRFDASDPMLQGLALLGGGHTAQDFQRPVVQLDAKPQPRFDRKGVQARQRIQYVPMGAAAQLAAHADLLKTTHVGSCVVVCVYRPERTNGQTPKLILAHVPCYHATRTVDDLVRFMQPLTDGLEAGDRLALVENQAFDTYPPAKLSTHLMQMLARHQPALYTMKLDESDPKRRLSVMATRQGALYAQFSNKLALLPLMTHESVLLKNTDSRLDKLREDKANDPHNDFPIHRVSQFLRNNREDYLAAIQQIDDAMHIRRQLHLMQPRECAALTRSNVDPV